MPRRAFRYIVGPAALFRALDSLRSRSGLMAETIPSSSLVSHLLITPPGTTKLGDNIRKLILSPNFESKIGSKEPKEGIATPSKNRQKLNPQIDSEEKIFG